jgi:peptidoglycan/LPS O-acetylase OafA/YrhL
LAFWVALSHIFCWCGFALFPFALPGLFRSTASRFWTQFSFAGGAVDTFIILSGFAISCMLHVRPQSYRQFMTGRFFRIYPVYLLCLLAGYATIHLMPGIVNGVDWRENEYFTLYVRPVIQATQAHPAAHLFAHLTLLYGIIPERVLPQTSVTLLAPAWSITLEWQYYLLAPFLAWFARRPAGLLVLGVVGCGSEVYEHFWSSAFLPEKLPLFLIGIGSFQIYAKSDTLKSFPHRRLLFAGLVAATLIVGWHWLALLIWLIAFGSVLADDREVGERWLLWPRRWLMFPSLQWVGKMSYPLYLVHWPLIIVLLAGLIRWQPGIAPGKALLVLVLVGLPVILSAAWLMHRWVEKPMMEFGKELTRAHTRAAAPSPREPNAEST